MEMDKEITKVIFRKWTNKAVCGDRIIALFPDNLYNDPRNLDSIMSYEHIGQHGEASFIAVLVQTDLAKPEEYAELQSELQSLGYNLQVCKRRVYHWYKEPCNQ